MLKIRGNCFETNSSSMDRYDDREYDGPDHSYARQDIFINLIWAEGTSDTRVAEILESIDESELFECLETLMEDADDFEIEDFDDGNIHASVELRARAVVTYEGCPATRYEPAEGPEYEFEYTGVPFKHEECPARNKVKADIMKLFTENGYTEVLGIENIYGTELDEGTLYDNLNY